MLGDQRVIHGRPRRPKEAKPPRGCGQGHILDSTSHRPFVLMGFRLRVQPALSNHRDQGWRSEGFPTDLFPGVCIRIGLGFNHSLKKHLSQFMARRPLEDNETPGFR